MRQWNKYVETREGPVKTEAQVGMMRPQSKKPQEPPGAGRGQEGFSSLPREAGPTDTNVGLLASRTVREEIPVI